VNASATPENPASVQLRDPDRRLAGERELRLVWDLAPHPDGGTYQAVVSVGHSKGQRGGGSFTATLLNQTEHGSEQDMGNPLDWKRFAETRAARYSAQQLEQFAGAALATLRAHMDVGDPLGLAGYFEVKP
jgi:hypothetical protein